MDLNTKVLQALQRESSFKKTGYYNVSYANEMRSTDSRKFADYEMLQLDVYKRQKKTARRSIITKNNCNR